MAVQVIVDRVAGPLIGAFPVIPLPEATFDWDTMPESLDPRFTLTGDRAERKREQCVSFARALQYVLDQHGGEDDGGGIVRVVDFGSGTGNASLPLTHWFRERCVFTLVDRFPAPIKLAQERIDAARLGNATAVESYIHAFDTSGFDVVFSSHACGSATDDALAKALSNQCAFVLCSCCVGKLKLVDSDTVVLPRSARARELMSREDFLNCARAADHDQNVEEDPMRAQAKLILEADRMALARENGYDTVFRTQLEPLSCSPKYDVVCGLLQGIHE